MIVDGRTLAGEILARARERASALAHPPRVVAIVGRETPATLSYLKIKAARAAEAGCTFETRPFGSSYEDADAVIVQLPLPEGVNQKEVCDAIPIEKDADVLGSEARVGGKLLPPVVGAISEIFGKYLIDPKNKNAAVLGKGFLVGAPAAEWLGEQGADVTIIEGPAANLGGILKTADIVVSGAGVPHHIQPDMLTEGVVLIDAGTSESGGAIVGDADPSCAPVCSLSTPVPGGVGPIAVAKLFENAVMLAERAK